jgi:hypothetical protein
MTGRAMDVEAISTIPCNKAYPFMDHKPLTMHALSKLITSGHAIGQ